MRGEPNFSLPTDEFVSRSNYNRSGGGKWSPGILLGVIFVQRDCVLLLLKTILSVTFFLEIK